MRLYAVARPRRTRQIVGDVGMLAWTAAWVLIGLVVHHLLAALTTPIDATGEAAASYRTTMTQAAKNLAGLPAVGGPLAKAFTNAARPGQSVSSAAAQTSTTVGQLALALGLLVAVGPILAVAVPWLRNRLAFARATRATQQLMAAGASLDLFALRSLNRQPLAALAQISSDPYTDWRNGDTRVVRALAALELDGPTAAR